MRAAITVVHGLGEHADRYRQLATKLSSFGIATLAYDQQGHGNSPGRRGAPRSYDSMLEDIDSARQTLAEHVEDVPQYLFGHSMGGNLATSYALRWDHNLAGLVLSAPMLLPTKPPRRDQIYAAWLTGKLLPFIRFNSPVSTEQLTHDRDEIAAVENDPKMHSKISLHLGTQLLAQGRHALDHARQLAIPTLVLHGSEDSTTDVSASHAFCLRAGGNASFVKLDGMYHDLIHEVDRALVFDAIEHWFENQLGP